MTAATPASGPAGQHLRHLVNIYTGIAYKDDATILSCELANEPRCRAYGVYPECAVFDVENAPP